MKLEDLVSDTGWDAEPMTAESLRKAMEKSLRVVEEGREHFPPIMVSREYCEYLMGDRDD